MNHTAAAPQGVRKDSMRNDPGMRTAMEAIFGADDEPVLTVLARARRLMADRKVVVWEADPLTFTFTFVSPEAEDLLGYPIERWQEPGFWSTEIVHPEDAGDAISHCAMATAAGADHDFQYRARTADGAVVRVQDVVHVMKGPLGFAACLRGIMFPIEDGAAA